MNNPLPDSSWLVLGLIIIFFIATNLGLWAAWKRKKQKNQYNWLNKFGESIRNPWQKEKNRLEELSKSVSEIRSSQNKTTKQIDTTIEQPYQKD